VLAQSKGFTASRCARKRLLAMDVSKVGVVVMQEAGDNKDLSTVSAANATCACSGGVIASFHQRAGQARTLRLISLHLECTLSEQGSSFPRLYGTPVSSRIHQPAEWAPGFMQWADEGDRPRALWGRSLEHLCL